MRRTAVSILKSVQKAELGTWRQSHSPELAYGIVPFVKGREDIEVLFREPDLLPQLGAVEMSGYGIEKILRRVGTLELELGREGAPRSYAEFTRVSQPIVSFPPELLWLAHPTPVETNFRDGIEKTLPVSSLALTPEAAKVVARRVCDELLSSPQKFTFWKALTARNRETTLPYSRLLIEYAVTASARARARAFAGIVPVVDAESPGSANLLHRWNLATADVVRDRLGDGLSTPAYLYTISINSGTILPDTPSSTLASTVGNARAALQGELADYFDGILLSVRGLSRISQSAGRTNVVMALVEKLSMLAKSVGVPLWWSRPGVAGLAGRDLGCAFTSYSMNLGVDDLYQEPGGGGDTASMCGKVLNATQRAYWSYHQVLRSLSGPDHGLPELGVARNAPTELELGSPPRYRVHFSKPYNVGAFRYLSSDWRLHLEGGETTPGREYLQSFEAPFNQWGLR